MLLHGHTVVYGGSFDPPHVCHQMSCLYLLEALGAAEVWLIPSFSHPFGKSLSDFDTRLAMCELLVEPLKPRLQVSAVERELGGAGRTFDTLTHLRSAHPQRRFALAVGSDIVGETHRWYRWKDIEAAFPVVVVGRAGYPHPQSPVELPAVASRALRQKAQRGESLEGLVPARVAQYIAAHGLYRDVP